ncbi:MAG: alpha/beta hydrolase [Candidatus Protistobacter heckmanni]|nr:alpha/beta hydrolase [Candidatus Protistobacter heckmanni]
MDLPGNGWGMRSGVHDEEVSLQSYTDHVLQVLDDIDEPVVLVGHSGGGITASQAAPERVSCVVYIAGMMPPSSRSFGDIINLCREDSTDARIDGIAPYLDYSSDCATTTVRSEGARRAAGLLRPQRETGRIMRPTLSAQCYGSVPRIYVECTEDRSVLPVLQRKMQTLSQGARCIVMECGHVPQLDQSRQLAERICPSLTRFLFEMFEMLHDLAPQPLGASPMKTRFSALRLKTLASVLLACGAMAAQAADKVIF